MISSGSSTGGTIDELEVDASASRGGTILIRRLFRGAWHDRRMRALALFLVLSGCADPTAHVVTPSRCAALEGRVFASHEELECGLTPTGVGYCPWHLTFSARDATSSRYDWQHSDYGETNTVTCTDDAVSGVGYRDTTYEGTYDATTELLVWDGHDYSPEP
jgi:hypothetical protein